MANATMPHTGLSFSRVAALPEKKHGNVATGLKLSYRQGPSETDMKVAKSPKPAATYVFSTPRLSLFSAAALCRISGLRFAR
jgi:hypothetical protein